MKHSTTKAILIASIVLSNTTISLANEAGKLAEGFTELFLFLLARLVLFILGFWLIGRILFYLLDKIQNRNKPQ